MPSALSPSRAADFMQCPLLYRFRVVDRLPEEPSPAAARGTLVHAVLERLFDLPAPERTLDAATALVPGEWARMVQEEPELAGLLADDDDTSWYAEAAGLVERWFRLEDPTVLEPAERELYVEAQLGDLTIRGIVDRLDEAPDGRLRVVDYKTGRAPSETFEGRALFQLKFYALALWRTRGVLPSRLQLVYLRDGQVLWIDPTERELLATERKIRALWSAIEQAALAGDWRPNRGRACSWCSYQAVCPAWGGTPPPLPQDAAHGQPLEGLHHPQPWPGLDLDEVRHRERRHAGGDRGGRPCRGVLDRHARGRVDAEQLGGQQVGLRVRLAAGDHVAGHDRPEGPGRQLLDEHLGEHRVGHRHQGARHLQRPQLVEQRLRARAPRQHLTQLALDPALDAVDDLLGRPGHRGLVEDDLRGHQQRLAHELQPLLVRPGAAGRLDERPLGGHPEGLGVDDRAVHVPEDRGRQRGGRVRCGSHGLILGGT